MSPNDVAILQPAQTPPSALPPFGVSEIRKRTHMIQEVMRGVMKEGTHYGTIPGTPKPSLWKAGAEVLCMTFRLAPMLESRVVTDDLDSEWNYHAAKRDGSIVNGICIGYFEVESTCKIIGPNGETLSRCSARCNNRESKYRSLPLFEIRNTILKMSEKRAFVSAVIMATGASDIFTQDIEDCPELHKGSQATPIMADMKNTKPPVVSHVSSPSPELQVQKTQGVKSAQGLTPRREAWLMRVAQEGQVPAAVMERCLSFLREAGVQKVGMFFDDLARKKTEALAPFRSGS